MGTVIIQEETSKNPISLIGKEAGVCYGSDTSSDQKNYKRGLMNLSSGHGRVLEFPQIYMILDGYSAKVIREYYTHIGGAPTRVQASTRYIDYGTFDYVIPPSIEKNPNFCEAYKDLMKDIDYIYNDLIELGVPKEDASGILPLNMTTKIITRTNLRNLIDMSHQRLCARAYWEYRQLMRDIMKALSEYSDEWKYLVDTYFVPKCDITGYCAEHNSCGRRMSQSEWETLMATAKETNN